MDANILLSNILGCGIDDINYLFSGMDDKLLYDAINEIHNENMKMSAKNLWTRCIQFATERVFGPQYNFIDTVFNCIDSRISIKKEYLKYIEGFVEKKHRFEKLVNDTLEIWEE